MRYKLLKDLPGAKAGTEFKEANNVSGYYTDSYGDIVDGTKETNFVSDTYAKVYPDFFEPLPEKPKTVWDLKELDEYWSIHYSGGIERCEWDNLLWEQEARNQGNIFLTKEEAEREVNIRRARTTILKQHAQNSGFVPDWKNGDEEKFAIDYSCFSKEFGVYSMYNYSHCAICYFSTEEEAKESIKACEKEWKVLFGVD